MQWYGKAVGDNKGFDHAAEGKTGLHCLKAAQYIQTNMATKEARVKEAINSKVPYSCKMGLLFCFT